MSNTISSKQSKPQTIVFLVVVYFFERDRINIQEGGLEF